MVSYVLFFIYSVLQKGFYPRIFWDCDNTKQQFFENGTNTEASPWDGQQKDFLDVSCLPLSIGVRGIAGIPCISAAKLLVGKAGLENLTLSGRLKIWQQQDLNITELLLTGALNLTFTWRTCENEKRGNANISISKQDFVIIVLSHILTFLDTP